MRKILLTIVSILVVILFGWIDFIQHNWYPAESTSTINTVLITTFVFSIIGRLIKKNWIILFMLIASDVILILYSYPGTVYGNLISSIINSFNLDYPKHIIAVSIGLAIFIIDWVNSYWSIKDKK